MTTLGKILVFANLVFSLVTGALIIMVFSTRTNWKSGYDKLNKAFTVSEANVRAYAEEVKQIKARCDADATQLKNQIATLQKENQRLDAETKAKDALHKSELARGKEGQGT